MGGLFFLTAFLVMSFGGMSESEACRLRRGYKDFDTSEFLDRHDDGSERKKSGPKGKAVFPKKMALELLSVGDIRPAGVAWMPCLGLGSVVFKVAEHKNYALKFEIVNGANVRWLPHGPVQPIDGELRFLRQANVYAPQRAIHVVVRARWVDRWGRESESLEPIEIYIPAVDEYWDEIKGQLVKNERSENWVELRE